MDILIDLLSDHQDIKIIFDKIIIHLFDKNNIYSLSVNKLNISKKLVDYIVINNIPVIILSFLIKNKNIYLLKYLVENYESYVISNKEDILLDFDNEYALDLFKKYRGNNIAVDRNVFSGFSGGKMPFIKKAFSKGFKITFTDVNIDTVDEYLVDLLKYNDNAFHKFLDDDIVITAFFNYVESLQHTN